MKIVKMKFDNQMRKMDARVQHFFDWMNKPAEGWELFAQNTIFFGGFLVAMCTVAYGLDALGD